MTWLLNEFDMTKLGWPVALPRFSSRPSDSTMIEWAGRSEEAGKKHSGTCGLVSVLTVPGVLGRAGMLVSLSEGAVLATVARCFFPPLWSGVVMALLAG